MDVRIDPFVPKTATREEWDRHHAFRRVRHEEEAPGDQLDSDELEEALLKRDNPEWFNVIHAAIDPATGGQVGIPWLDVMKETSPSYAENGHIGWLHVGVVRSHRRGGIGTRLLRIVREPAKEHKLTRILGGAFEADGKAFLRAIGADVGDIRRESRLDLTRMDWTMVESWARDGAERNPGTTLRWMRDGIDEDVIEAYAKVYTEIGNQDPRNRLEVGDLLVTPENLRDRADRRRHIGATWLTVMSVERDRSISGLTETVYHPDDEHIIGQALTGVREPWRGRKIGKWLKAAMLLRVREEFPHVRVVSTWNSTTNAAMLAINNALGFRENRVADMSQMTVQLLEAYLARKKAPA